MKLYLAQLGTLSVVFVHENSPTKAEGYHFLVEEFKCNKSFYQNKQIQLLNDSVDVLCQEITCLEQVPAEWDSVSLIWGCEEELSAEDFFFQQKEAQEHAEDEKREYLRLKNKYESKVCPNNI